MKTEFKYDKQISNFKLQNILTINVCDGASHNANMKSSSYKTYSAAQSIKSVPSRVEKLLLFVLLKPLEPYILGSHLHKVTIRHSRYTDQYIIKMTQFNIF